MRKQKYDTKDTARRLNTALDAIIAAQKGSSKKVESRVLGMVLQENKRAAKGNKILLTSFMLIAMTSTGCSSLAGENLFTGDKGRFLLSADGEGMRQFSSALNGLVTTGKASPDVKGAYWEQQEKEVGVKVMRFQVLNSKKAEVK